MQHFRSRLTQRVGALALVGGLLGGAFVAGVPALAGATTPAAVVPAFSGPQPPAQELEAIINEVLLIAELGPAQYLAATEAFVQKLLASSEGSLGGL
jgi:hypothetical protein